MRSTRNKTMTLDGDEAELYLSRCVEADSITLDQNFVDTVIHGDTFEALKHIKSESVDLAIIDPPYNMNKTFGEDKFYKTDINSYAEYTLEWIRLVKPLLKPTGSIYVCCDWESGIAIAPILQEHFVVRNRITWQREKGRASKRNWKNAMEDIWFATVGDTFTFNADAVKQRRKVIAPYKVDGVARDWSQTKDGKFRDTGASNFWDDISVPYWSMPENTPHPTQKPEKLMAKLILASSNEGDVVLDPFAGSGSSCVTAAKLGRRYIGIEKDATYCAMAQKRIDMAKKDSSIQGYVDGVFWERNTLAEQRRNKKQ